MSVLAWLGIWVFVSVLAGPIIGTWLRRLRVRDELTAAELEGHSPAGRRARARRRRHDPSDGPNLVE